MLAMKTKSQTAAASDFRRTIILICVAGVLMAAGALWYTSLFLPLTIVVVSATVGGVFLSVLLGCGLFALGFYSDKSGHDDRVNKATRAKL